MQNIGRYKKKLLIFNIQPILPGLVLVGTQITPNMMFYIVRPAATLPIADNEDDDKMSWPVFLGPKTVLLAPRPGKKSGSSQVFPGACSMASTFATPHKSTAWLMPPCGDPFSSTRKHLVHHPSFHHLFQLFKPHFNGWQKSELIGWLDSSKRSP